MVKPAPVLRISRFNPGSIVLTAHAKDILDMDEVHSALQRHLDGDWGECCKEDWNENENSLEHGGRLFSAYIDEKGQKFWIITEADRSSTCVLLPENY